ncbi:hypothetical protein ABZZ74_23485 [Streptomyces sp. NPDC006476]|uniref:hypothetical protein n=1 Tax=Streptomyces sp. NPDC006476 TaxID=3157175 RepID=UPI0033A1AA83
MPFGNGDREVLRQISSQLGQAVADLAALKQQVADQQHTIDQIRQDATAAITTGLAEIRAVARDGLARTNEIATGPLANIGNELVAIRGNITQLGAQIQQAPTLAAAEPTSEAQPDDHTPELAPNPEPDDQAATEQPGDDPAILQAAAGISAATLHAHRDTWEFLVKHAGQDQHFHLPATATANEGAIEVAVSGPTLVAALTRLAAVNKTAADTGTAAIAGHLHARLTETIEEIVTRPHRGDGAEPVRIVIDDRAGPVDEEQ